MGLVTACYTITATLIRPFGGYVIDRVGRMPVLLPSFFLFGLLFLLYPLAASVLFIAFLRLSHGVVWGTYMGAVNTVAVDLVPASRRGEGIGIFGLCMSITMALGPALGVALAGKFGFDTLFLVSGIFLLIMFVPTLKIRAPKVELTVKPFSWKGLIEKTSLPLSLVTVFVYFSYGPIVNYTALYARTEIQASAGLFFMLMAFGMALARVFAGRSYDRRGPRDVMIVSFTLLVIGYGLQALTRSAVCFYAAALIIGVGFGIVMPVSQAMINALVGPERRGAANATLMTALDIGICLSIVVVGYLQADFGWNICLWSEVVGVILGAVTFFGYALPHYHKVMAENRCKN
jgi:MFS family permease